MADRRAADAAGFALPFVDEEPLLEVTGLAVGVEEIPQGGAAFTDRVREHLADGLDEFSEAGFGNLVRHGLRPDAGAEQGFGRVDVSHAHHRLRVHDDELDRGGAFRADLAEVRGGEILFQRLWPERA